jgi:hypothetical protein
VSTFFRNDQWITDALGNALAGVSVYYSNQPPAQTGTLPPSNLASLYADSEGVTPLTQPLTSDGYGHVFAYLGQGIYSIVIASPQIVTRVLPDQVIVSPTSVPTNWNNDSSNAGTITGTVNGVNTVFTLSATPTPPASLIFSVNGVLQSGWTISGNVVTLALAPHTGNQLNAIYQVN